MLTKTPSRFRARFILLSFIFYLFPAVSHSSFITSLSATHIQSVLQTHFPLREYATGARVSLHDPQVLLVKDAGISLMIPVEANIPGEGPRHGHARVSVSLNYRAPTGELFLHDPRMEQFEIAGVSDAMKNELATTVSIMTAKALPLVRIYMVKEQDLNHSLDKSALKSFAVENNQLRIEFGFQ